MKRVYLFILGAFFLYLLLLNLVSSSSGAGRLFYLKERSAAAVALVKHIAFESGIFLPEVAEEEIVSAVLDACRDTRVDPALVMLIISHTNGSYSINFDGSFGLMRLKFFMLSGENDFDPYIYTNNIKAGVKWLDILTEQTGDVEEALRKYLEPVSVSATPEDRAKMAAYAQTLYKEYIAAGGKPTW